MRKVVTERGNLPVLPSEALSAHDIARLFPSLTTESAARRLLLSRVRARETGFNTDGGPLRVRGTWLSTLEWWRRTLTLHDGEA